MENDISNEPLLLSPSVDSITDVIPLSRSPKKKITSFIVWLTMLSALSGTLFGYDTGVVSGAMLSVKRNIFLTPFQHEFIVSIAIGGAIIGGCAAGWLSDYYGRRPVIIFASFSFIVGGILMATAVSVVSLLVGRAVVGIGVGMASMTAPLYIAEAAPFHMRGRLITVNTIFVTGGQLVAALIDGAFQHIDYGWRWMFGLSVVPAIIQLIGFTLMMPESPRHLVRTYRVEAARMVLSRIRGEERHNVDTEIVEIQKSLQVPSVSFFDSLCTSEFMKPLMIGCFLQALQQLTGINTVMYYSATILHSVTNESTAVWLASAVAFVNFLFTFVGFYCVERFGRRKLLLWSLAGVTLSLALLGVAVFMSSDDTPVASDPSNSECVANTCFSCVIQSTCGFCDHKMSGSCLPVSQHATCSNESWSEGYCRSNHAWLMIVALMIYIACFAPGMGPMPWTINAEIFPPHLRSRGVGIATTVNWTANLVVSMTFLTLMQSITGAGTFWLYTGIGAVGWFIAYFVVPETRGITLEDMNNIFI